MNQAIINMKQATNNPDIEFKDISHERYRTYIFPQGEEVRIENPVKLHVSESGGHRVQDDNSVAHYIPSGWIHLYWETVDDVSFWF